ncbi:TetR family transcriptional regulator [Kitasatospora kazusensis]|uniref:TetR family transcriptional regulator n=1 Tax=Kitasatospora kazusensis TaxID=407974 RepID=A0ABN2ZM28_9ACTN
MSETEGRTVEARTTVAPQQQRSREKVARILAAAGQLLETRPYAELGTKLIAAEAGVSVGVLYRFFPDKEAIVASLMRDWLERFVVICEEITGGPLPEDPHAFHAALIDAYAAFYRQEPGFRQVWLQGAGLPSLQDEGDANDRQLAELVHEVRVRRYGTPDTPETRRRTLLAVVLVGNLLNQAFRTDPQGDPDILAEAVVLVDRYFQESARA